MKILFGIQGTGNGHISRCVPVIQELISLGHQVDVLMSGVSHELTLPFPIKYKKMGLSYIFGKKGGIDLFRTLLKCNIFQLTKEIVNCPVNQYQLVITDFEPITAWASKIRKINCLGFGNQYAAKYYPIKVNTLQEKLGVWFLKHFAPVSKAVKYDYLQNTHQKVFFPLINPLILSINVKENPKLILIYLPAHDRNALTHIANSFKNYTFISYSKWMKEDEKVFSDNLRVKKINELNFNNDLRQAKFVLTAAGFGLTSELIQFKKNMMVIPMKGQVEQKINADKLKKLGFSVCYSHKDIAAIKKWLAAPYCPPVYPTTSVSEIAQSLLQTY